VTANITRLIEAIAAPEAPFDIEDWIAGDGPYEEQAIGLIEHRCGSAGCIGGWAASLRIVETKDWGSLFRESDTCEWLGISRPAGDELFYGIGFRAAANKEETLEVLAGLRDTGWVDWTIIPRLADDSDLSYAPGMHRVKAF
jgi:hypothetical protein